MEITSRYSPEADVSFYRGDCRRLLKQIPPESARLLVTSPPYNLGKPYERPRRSRLICGSKPPSSDCASTASCKGGASAGRQAITSPEPTRLSRSTSSFIPCLPSSG